MKVSDIRFTPFGITSHHPRLIPLLEIPSFVHSCSDRWSRAFNPEHSGGMIKGSVCAQIMRVILFAHRQTCLHRVFLPTSGFARKSLRFPHLCCAVIMCFLAMQWPWHYSTETDGLKLTNLHIPQSSIARLVAPSAKANPHGSSFEIRDRNTCRSFCFSRKCSLLRI